MNESIEYVAIGVEFCEAFPDASRFDLANYLYGYNGTLTFDQLTDITGEVGKILNKREW